MSCDPSSACTLFGYCASALSVAGAVIVYLYQQNRAMTKDAIKREADLADKERERAAELERILWEQRSA